MRRSDSADGAVAVEAAFLSILLLTLLTGIIQFSWVLAASLNIRNASAVGARSTILQSYTDYTDSTQQSNLVAEVRAALTQPLDPNQMAVVWDEVTVTTAGGNITYQRVATSYPLSLAVLRFVPGVPSTITLNAETRMR